MIFFIRRFNRLTLNRDRFSPASVFTLSAISFILGGSCVFVRAYNVSGLIHFKYSATNIQVKMAFPFKVLPSGDALPDPGASFLFIVLV